MSFPRTVAVVAALTAMAVSAQSERVLPATETCATLPQKIPATPIRLTTLLRTSALATLAIRTPASAQSAMTFSPTPPARAPSWTQMPAPEPRTVFWQIGPTTAPAPCTYTPLCPHCPITFPLIVPAVASGSTWIPSAAAPPISFPPMAWTTEPLPK